MSATEIMTEIDRLSESARDKVLRFTACRAKGQLTGEEIGELTRQMVESNDPQEKEALKEQIFRGFYGDEGPLA